MNEYFDRINSIARILDSVGIPYKMNECWEGYQLRFPWCDGDVAAHDHTYETKSGAVESYCFPWDDGDVSVLTPRAAAIKIIAYYNEEVLG